MKAFFTRISVVLSCVVMVATAAQAQDISGNSGVPGDGIPDFYYFADDATIMTSAGELSFSAGEFTVDTDGTNMIGVLVTGPNAITTTPDDGTYLIEGGRLPQIGEQFGSQWTIGFVAASFQGIRVAPLTGDGFVGVIGDPAQFQGDADPFGIYPDNAYAYYGDTILSEADFPRDNFEDDNGELWGVLYSQDTQGRVYSNVTVVRVPEPATAGLLGLAALGMMFVRRIIG